MAPLTHDELEQVASAIYERAKRDWLRVVRERKVPSTRF
jgi:ribosomal protein S10